MSSPLSPDNAAPLGFYGVSVTAVSDELPTLFPSGFSADSLVSRDLVRTWILDNDDAVASQVRTLGLEPVPTVRTAQRYVIARVVLQVVAAVYMGNDPASVASILATYRANVTALSEALLALGAQLAGGTVAPSGVRASFPTRTPLVADEQLSGDRRIRSAT